MYIGRIRNAISWRLHHFANKLEVKPYEFKNQYLNIGRNSLSKDAKRALVLYNMPSIPFFLQGRLEEFCNINAHSMYWEAAEMVRILNEQGYIVDYIHFMSNPEIVWEKYDLIIDSWDFLKEAHVKKETKTVFYATGAQWLIHNMAELRRICSFKERNGICLPADRLIPSIQSYQYARYTTVFGNDWQKKQYEDYSEVYPLNISSVFIPQQCEKDIGAARKNFLWMGGGGMIHKGLDLVIEAFEKIPQYHLYIAGNPANEHDFWSWFKPILERSNNIHLEGWQDVSSQKFAAIANQCIGIVYTSAAEGGPGAVAQALHFGLIPIVTETSNVKAQHLGYVIKDEDPLQIIEKIKEYVKELAALTDEEIFQKSEAARQYALKYHTREAYSNSFSDFIKYIDEK